MNPSVNLNYIQNLISGNRIGRKTLENIFETVSPTDFFSGIYQFACSDDSTFLDQINELLKEKLTDKYSYYSKAIKLERIIADYIKSDDKNTVTFLLKVFYFTQNDILTLYKSIFNKQSKVSNHRIDYETFLYIIKSNPFVVLMLGNNPIDLFIISERLFKILEADIKVETESRYFIKSVLKQELQNGNTYVTTDIIKDYLNDPRCFSVCSFNYRQVYKQLKYLVDNKKVYMVVTSNKIRCYALAKVYKAELESAVKIQELLKNKNQFLTYIHVYNGNFTNLKVSKLKKVQLEALQLYIKQHDWKMSDKVADISYSAMNEAITLVTGPAGSGKTTSLVNSVKLLEPFMTDKFLLNYGKDQGVPRTKTIKNKIKLAKEIYNHQHDTSILNRYIGVLGTTGLATRKDQDVLDSHGLKIECQTVTALLTSYIKTANKKAKQFPHILFVDEASMLDIFELQLLLHIAQEHNIHLVFVGDENQLPSVQAGSVLKDLLSIDKLSKIKLDTLYRQNENSELSNLSSDILTKYEANYPFKKLDINSLIQDNNNEVNFFSSDDNKVDLILLINTLLTKYDFKDIFVIAATRNVVHGINKKLQNYFYLQNLKDSSKSLLGTDEDRLLFKYTGFHIYDRVIQQHNRPDKNIINGERGVIVGVKWYPKIQRLNVKVQFDGHRERTEFTYKVKEHYGSLFDITLGYAMTIHKSQGSECKACVVVLDEDDKSLTKPLLYTAVTRATKQLNILGSNQLLERGLNRHIHRRELMRYFLKHIRKWKKNYAKQFLPKSAKQSN